MAAVARRVLLMEPPFGRLFHRAHTLPRHPLSLGYLTAAVRQHTDWEVMSYNADFARESQAVSLRYLMGPGYEQYLRSLNDPSGPVWAEVKRTIEEFRPTLLGISAKSQNFKAALMVAKLAKEVDPHTVVVLGGPHPSMAAADSLRHPQIDVCVRGEGEATLVELLRAIQQGSSLAGIQGLSYRSHGEVVENPPRPLLDDLDSLGFPHDAAPEVLKDYDRYPSSAFSRVFATRGCPSNCTFCGSREVWGRKVRFRSAGNVAEEIRRLQERGVRTVHFDDDTFGVNRRYIAELCQALAETCPGLKWSCELHVRLVTDENLAAMRAAGCERIHLGVESGSDEILKQVRKGITAEQALAAAQSIRKHGLRVWAFFMLGFPQETEETIGLTYRLMKRIPAERLIYSIFTPYPGTEMFAQCKAAGLVDDDFDVSLYNHSSPANCFCANLTPPRFRALASRVEKLVDRKNGLSRLRRLFSSETVAEAGRLGLARSLRKGLALVRGR